MCQSQISPVESRVNDPTSQVTNHSTCHWDSTCWKFLNHFDLSSEPFQKPQSKRQLLDHQRGLPGWCRSDGRKKRKQAAFFLSSPPFHLLNHLPSSKHICCWHQSERQLPDHPWSFSWIEGTGEKNKAITHTLKSIRTWVILVPAMSPELCLSW